MEKIHNSLHMKNILPYALSFALLGAALGAGSTYALTRQNEKPLLAVDHSSMQMASNSMADGLKGKTGDEFDKAFISQMIEHHEGAVVMAVQARQDARHDEIKAMAEDIISAQTREINQMKNWQKQWGY